MTLLAHCSEGDGPGCVRQPGRLHGTIHPLQQAHALRVSAVVLAATEDHEVLLVRDKLGAVIAVV